MKLNKFIFIAMLFICSSVAAQIDGTLLLGLTQATTSQMNSISNPVSGSIIFNTTQKSVFQYNGSSWENLASTGNIISIDADNDLQAGSDGGAFFELNSTTTTIKVNQSALWAGQVNDTDIHSNGTLTVNQTRADSGWSFSGPSNITYTGSPDFVEIDLMAVANNTGNHWAHPHIKVYRNGQQIGEGSGLHMDDSGSYSGRTTTVISMVDPTPGSNPVYTFRTLEDDNRTMNNPTITSLSPVSLVAVNKVDVVISVSN